MSNITKERLSKEEVDIAVNELIMKEENDGFERGELKPFLEKLSEKYNVPFGTLKNRYYKEVKVNAKPNRVSVLVKKSAENEDKKENKVVSLDSIKLEIKEAVPITKEKEPKNPLLKINSVDEDIQKFAEKPVDKIFTSPKDYYKLNQLVDVKVANIQSYGAFVEILDGKGFNALLHISEIVDGYINDVKDYLEVGQVLHKVKICYVDIKKINVSSKHLHLSKKEVSTETTDEVIKIPSNPPVNTIGEKFGSLKDKLLQRIVETTAVSVKEDKEEQSEIEEIFALEELSKNQEDLLKKYDKDIIQMTSYLQEELGALSKPAKLALAKIIEEHGLFNTTRAIIATQSDFKADIGLLFMQQMSNKIGEYL